MGKLRVIKTGPMATIQDKGRFGYRQFGIPQSGVIDFDSMAIANFLVGNPNSHPVIEYALAGMKLEALEDTLVGVSGAEIKSDGQDITHSSIHLLKGNVLELSPPKKMYGYLAVGGLLKANKEFGSYSTYIAAEFGGIEGRALQIGDVLETDGDTLLEHRAVPNELKSVEEITTIRIMKGPEWSLLQELPTNKVFTIDPASNRMGIRLSGSTLKCDGSEIISSAVIPGTIQLPSNGQPIVLMNDCQTTGGYPRIGKVLEEDMGKLAQVPYKKQVEFVVV